MLELFHSWRSTCSRRVRIALAEKGLKYTGHPLNLLRFEHHTPEYLKLNPNGYVPTLLHDGVPYIESTVINEYLDDVFPAPPLRPADAAARARMRVWTKFVDDYALPAVVVPTWSDALKKVAEKLSDAELRRRLDAIPLKERRDRWEKIARSAYTPQEFAEALGKLELMMTRMDAALAHGPWLAGEAFSLADVNIAPYVVRAGEIDPQLHDAGRWPRAMEWYARIQARQWFDQIFRTPPPVPPALFRRDPGFI
ncbi:MAG: glutathione S-transferase family protein [Alphaproteobacteria bacterium]